MTLLITKFVKNIQLFSPLLFLNWFYFHDNSSEKDRKLAKIVMKNSQKSLMKRGKSQSVEINYTKRSINVRIFCQLVILRKITDKFQ